MSLNSDERDFLLNLHRLCLSQGITINFENLVKLGTLVHIQRVHMDNEFDPSYLMFTVEFAMGFRGDIEATAIDINIVKELRK